MNSHSSSFTSSGAATVIISDWPDMDMFWPDMDMLWRDDIPGDTSTPYHVAPGDPEGSRIGFGDGGDTDWFRLDVEAGKTYEIKLGGDGLWGLPLPVGAIEFRDESGKLLGESDPMVLFDQDTKIYFGPVSAGSGKAFFTATQDETIFVAVKGVDGAMGDYSVKVKERDVSDDHSNIRRDATKIQLNEAVDGSLDWKRDEDVFKFRVEEGQSYKITLRGDPDSGDPADWVAYTLTNKAGRMLANNMDLADGPLHEESIFVAAKDQVLYLEVNGLFSSLGGNSSTKGDYELLVEEVPTGTTIDEDGVLTGISICPALDETLTGISICPALETSGLFDL